MRKASGLPETVALTTGRPILVVPYIGAKQPPGKVVLLCWNASCEGVDAAAWLRRHGVNASVHRDVAPDNDVGGIILSRAADHGADLIVMGLYGHSRMREMVLGAASRTLLSSMTVPVFMAH
jgi:Universal stress protein family